MQKAIIITAPSGAGKTTLVRKLLENRSDLAFSVSACTRAKRFNEIEGKDYYFLSIEAFQAKIKEGAFLEYEEVYEGMYYGTLESEVNRIWKDNKAVIFDIDVKGAVSLKKKLKDKAISIFIDPPSIEHLMERLKGRKTESDETIAIRLKKAQTELAFKEQMDDFVVNDKLEDAYQELFEKVETFIYQS